MTQVQRESARSPRRMNSPMMNRIRGIHAIGPRSATLFPCRLRFAERFAQRALRSRPPLCPNSFPFRNQILRIFQRFSRSQTSFPHVRDSAIRGLRRRHLFAPLWRNTRLIRPIWPDLSFPRVFCRTFSRRNRDDKRTRRPSTWGKMETWRTQRQEGQVCP